jgi:hypothetical protein
MSYRDFQLAIAHSRFAILFTDCRLPIGHFAIWNDERHSPHPPSI